MRFTVGTITQCESGGHRHILITVGQVTRTLTIMRGDAGVDPDETEDRVKARLFSALKESGASLTLASWNTALNGKEFHI